MSTHTVSLVTCGRIAVAAAVCCLVLSPATAQDALVIDHACIDVEQAPPEWIEAAKAQFRLSYGHTSHGSQIVSGMNVIRGAAGSLYYWDHDGVNGLSMWDTTPSGDLGNPDRYTWEVRTREMLDTPGCDRNVVMWSWCGQASTSEENMQIYLDLMDGLIADYEDVTFIYMTGHVNGGGLEGQLHQRNNQIRDHVMAAGGVLFDFADIESYDPDAEEYYMPYYVTDNCDYVKDSVPHNWATEWCAAHPGECSSTSCAHSQSLNCDMKGRAFWWMMARLAGWPGPDPIVGDIDGDGCVDLADLAILLASYNIDAGGDVDNDGDTDLADLAALLGNYGVGCL